MSRFSMLIATFMLSFTFMNTARAETVLEALQSIESDLSARVGFYMQDLQTSDAIEYAADDRFPLNSTFKLFACAALLAKVDVDEVSLDETVPLSEVDMVSYSPALKKHISADNSDVSLGQACQMMLSVSDNTAANIVLSKIGGPAGITAFMRSIGDHVTRLDRWETALNEARPNDPRDTTTPRAIAQSLRQVLLGNVLSAASKETLRDWLAQHSVADTLFRAALPAGWAIEDRTGAGGYGSRAIIAILYPPDRAPILATLFITQTDAIFKSRNAAVARVGAAIVAR